MNVWGLTDKGVARSQNQDAYKMELFHENTKGLCVVCDGMGGANAGDIASGIAAQEFYDDMMKNMRSSLSPKSMQILLEHAVSEANRHVYEKAQGEYSGMGTTLVGAFVVDETAVIANVGDSRAYHLTQNGINQITRDHSEAEIMLDRGLITKEQARNYHRKNYITRALGTEAVVECDFYELQLAPGDFLLLCSDGLSNMLSDQEIFFDVVHGGPPENAPARLIEQANKRGGLDNITAVILIA